MSHTHEHIAHAELDLSCKDVLDFLMAYLDDELRPDVRRAFEEHLRVCRSCVNYLESYRATVRLVRAAANNDQSHVPESIPEALVRAVRDVRSQAASSDRR